MIHTEKIFRPDRNPRLQELLTRFDLTLPENTDDNVGLYDGDQLVGCGFLKGNMFQGIAIDPAYQGEGLSATLISALIQLAVQRGMTYYQIITKPSMATMFMNLGFRRVADASPYAVFLENGAGSVAAYAKSLQEFAQGAPEPRACLVMNCNPFTLGHRYLVEKAAAENPWVFLLVVEEDRSEFPFADRIRLVREGVRDLPNVQVLSGGDYVISSRTFPAYFTRQESLSAAQGAMDAAVFAAVVAPALGVARRYVGTEPFSASTALYNEALTERLPPRGIEVVVVERTSANGEIISASKVRQCLREGDWDQVKKLVPESTWAYLRSGAAEHVIENMKHKE